MATVLSQASFTVTLLKGPKGKPDAKALGILDGVVVGTPSRAARPNLCWWPAREVAEPIVIDGVKPLECSTARQRICARLVKPRGNQAIVISREANGFVATSLHPKGWSESIVRDSDGEQHVGWGTTKDGRRVGVLWSRGTVIELGRGNHPVVNGVSGGFQVGADEVGGNHHAMLWAGSPESAVDLHPDKLVFQSEITATDGPRFVGSGINRKAQTRALLWQGSPTQCIDLTPKDARSAAATACAGGFQVGYLHRGETNEASEAVLWAGPDVVVSLHALVPAPYTSSAAWGVAVHGDRLLVVGGSMDYADCVNRGERAVLWEAKLR